MFSYFYLFFHIRKKLSIYSNLYEKSIYILLAECEVRVKRAGHENKEEKNKDP